MIRPSTDPRSPQGNQRPNQRYEEIMAGLRAMGTPQATRNPQNTPMNGIEGLGGLSQMSQNLAQSGVGYGTGAARQQYNPLQALGDQLSGANRPNTGIPNPQERLRAYMNRRNQPQNTRTTRTNARRDELLRRIQERRNQRNQGAAS